MAGGHTVWRVADFVEIQILVFDVELEEHFERVGVLVDRVECCT